MMRVTTFHAYAASVRDLQQRSVDLAQANHQLTSGKRVLQASDDPAAAARAERARALTQRTQAQDVAIAAARNAMTLTESALGETGDLILQARDLLMSAGNASYTDAERGDIANQLAAIRNQLLGVANRTDGNGNYVFGGQGSSQPPFLEQPGGVAYVGLGGSVMVGNQEQVPLSLDGNAIWMGAPSGNGVFTTAPVAGSNSGNAWIDGGHVSDPSAINGSSYDIVFTDNGGGNITYDVLENGSPIVSGASYVSGQSIEIHGQAVTVSGNPASGDTFHLAPSTPSQSLFSALDDTINALKTPNQSGSQITQIVNSGIGTLDTVRNHIQSARSMAGEVLNRMDQMTNRNADMRLFAETTRSDAEDLDMIAAISEVQNQTIGINAAMQSYASIQRLSLFDYIK